MEIRIHLNIFNRHFSFVRFNFLENKLILRKKGKQKKRFGTHYRTAIFYNSTFHLMKRTDKKKYGRIVNVA